jgi:hypothetical protein
MGYGATAMDVAADLAKQYSATSKLRSGNVPRLSAHILPHLGTTSDQSRDGAAKCSVGAAWVGVS